MTTRKTRRATCVVGMAVALVCLVILGSMTAPFTQEAQAVTFQALSVGQMCQYSDTVVLARTLSTSTRVAPGYSGGGSSAAIETVVQLQVLEVLKGASPTYRPLVLPGGTAGGVTMNVDYVPAFIPGETSVLFIDRQGRIVGGPQGKMVVVEGEVPSLGVSLARLRSWVTTGSTNETGGLSVAGGLAAGGGIHAAADWPLITGISPSSASAGTNSRVTIKGSGFGANRDMGSVTFWYGNLGHTTITAPVVSWSDAAIVCVVPTAVIDGYGASAGSGPVTVVTASGQTSKSFDFHVTFSYSGSRWSSPSLSYRVNSNTPDISNEEALVDAAARTWNSASDFRFVDAGACTISSTKGADGHNDMYWSETALPAGVAAATFWWTKPNKPDVMAESDIVFNDLAGIEWGDGSNGTIDVQAVALHEMGHCLGLLDLYGAADRAKVMYGIEESSARAPRALTDDDIAGAVYMYGGGSGGNGGSDNEGGDDGGGGDDSNSDSNLFSDLTADSPYFAAVTDLAGQGIITGFSDGTFRPDQTVTRQQFAKMIVKTLGLPVTGDELCSFTDVIAQTGTDPLYPAKYVAVCAANGITTGKTETTFAPKDSITRQQLITMVTRATDLASPSDGYEPVFSSGQFSLEDHYLNACKAAYVGLLDGLVGFGAGYDFKTPTTRAECAQILSSLRREQPLQGPRVLFADDFSGSEAGWPEFQLPDWRWLRDASLGQYTCTIDTADTLSLSCLPEDRGGCTVEVDGHCASTTEDVGYGVVFRVSSDAQSFYGFTVSSKGYWELWRRTNGAWGAAEVLATKASSTINKGKAWNQVKVTADASNVELSVNGSQVYMFTTAQGSSGLVGLVGTSALSASGHTSIAFDNFKIWSLR